MLDLLVEDESSDEPLRTKGNRVEDHSSPRFWVFAEELTDQWTDRIMALMPELPEVETVVRDLQKAGVCGHRIVSLKIHWPGCIAGMTARSFRKRVCGKTITAIRRRGKYLVFDLGAGEGTLLLHLRMSGRLRLNGRRGLHDRMAFALDNGFTVRFSDPRKFGRWRWVVDAGDVLGDLGPEPFDRKLTGALFYELIRSSRRRIKAVLLDQQVVAGIGNIYADESLWRARLDPERPACRVTAEEAGGLLRAVRAVLKTAIKNRGSTLGPGPGHYADADGVGGVHQTRLAVYGRGGEPCFRCGETIQRRVVAQRGTHVCPRCQKS